VSFVLRYASISELVSAHRASGSGADLELAPSLFLRSTDQADIGDEVELEFVVGRARQVVRATVESVETDEIGRAHV
jgi:hypothetical protein